MNNSEAVKLISLLRKNTFKDLMLRTFCDEMLILLKDKAVAPIIYSRRKKLITLRVGELSVGLFDDNTLMMMQGNNEPEMTMIPIYLFKEVYNLFESVENTK
ncbi:hypothetical phage protein [Psychrobacter phage Psymv2]|uniref:hypothetical protein n=1 Tax=Psychrobacter phage Psymv2 TaxID=1071177 RepID=UPI00022A37F0|nr:hypothetical protein CJ96_gp17 [Psychrobacter phage Psymv2]AEO00998.1 hypothetical phage protein [Psychrobacter phage Psymv2]